MVGRDFGGHLHVENDETNATVLTNASTDDRWWPATRGGGAVVRLTGGDGAPVIGGVGGGAAGLPHPLAKPTVATASGGDGANGGGAAGLRPAAGRLDTRGGGATEH